MTVASFSPTHYLLSDVESFSVRSFPRHDARPAGVPAPAEVFLSSTDLFVTNPPHSSQKLFSRFAGLPPTLHLWKGSSLKKSADLYGARIPQIDNPLASAVDFHRLSAAIPLDWILDPAKQRTLADRILARLIQSEAHEPDVSLRDDYRQTFIGLSLAVKKRGAPAATEDPRRDFIEASYVMYGLHPDQLWPAIIERRQALLGRPLSIAKKKAARPQSAVERRRA